MSGMNIRKKDTNLSPYSCTSSMSTVSFNSLIIPSGSTIWTSASVLECDEALSPSPFDFFGFLKYSNANVDAWMYVRTENLNTNDH